jgi:hypothetical protein
VECHAGRPRSCFPAVMHFTGRDSKPTMSTRPASFSQRREVGFRGPFGAGPNGLYPPCGRGPGRNPGQANHTRRRPSARRQRRCRPQTHTQRGVPATHARRRRPKTIDGAYQMQGSSGPLQMHPASQLRLNGVLGSSASRCSRRKRRNDSFPGHPRTVIMPSRIITVRGPSKTRDDAREGRMWARSSHPGCILPPG